MSLYIGENSNGDSIIHITSDKASQQAMQSGVMSSTVFHNDLEFLTIDLYPVSTVIQGTLLYYGGTYRKAYTTLYSSVGVSKIYGSESYILLDSNKNVWSPSPRNTGQDYGYRNGSRLEVCNCRTATTNPSQYYPYLAFWSEWGVISGLSYIGIISNKKLINGYGVNISNNIFQVGNVDMYNFKYIYQGTLNDHPSSIQLNPGMQIIDSSLISGSIELKSDGAGTTILSKGGYPIVSSGGQFLIGSGIVTQYTYIVSSRNNIMYLDNGTNIAITIKSFSNYIINLTEGYTLSIDTFNVIDYSTNPSTYYSGSLTLHYSSGILYTIGVNDYIGSSVDISIEVFEN